LKPSFKAAGVGIHVLDVEASIDVLAATGDDGNVQNVLCVCERRVSFTTIADQHGIFGDQGLQYFCGCRRREIVQDMIGRRPGLFNANYMKR
jgi:hypothetical protein